MKNYLYISASGDGWTNLGTDEWFLEHIAPDEMALYFYINDNAVILGRNQNPYALLFSLLVGNLTLKPLVARPRPCWRNPSVNLLIQNPN